MKNFNSYDLLKEWGSLFLSSSNKSKALTMWEYIRRNLELLRGDFENGRYLYNYENYDLNYSSFPEYTFRRFYQDMLPWMIDEEGQLTELKASFCFVCREADRLLDEHCHYCPVTWTYLFSADFENHGEFPCLSEQSPYYQFAREPFLENVDKVITTIKNTWV